ncbi:nucleoside triphosphate pyrophosphatase [Microvirgula curvata]
MRLVLASTSRFRREILSRLGLPFEAIAPDCDETPLPGETAVATACRLARQKAESLRAACPDALIIGSDQVALLDGRQLGKPGTVAHAVDMLKQTRGRALTFHTALSLINTASGRVQEQVDITTVRMRDASDAQIAAYLAHEPEAVHCAGGCMSEALGGALIERIESTDPNALVGLPLFALVTLLKNEGVEVL